MNLTRNGTKTQFVLNALLSALLLAFLPGVGAAQQSAAEMAAEARELLNVANSAAVVAEAKGRIDAALAKDPRSTDALVQRARWQMKSTGLGPSALESAEADLRHALGIDPGHAGAYVLLGYVLTNQKRYDEATTALDTARKLGSKDPWLAVNTGDLLLAQGKLDAAEKHYDRMFNDADVPGPERIDGYIGLARRLADRGERERGRDVYRRMLSAGVDDPVVLASYSHFLRVYLLNLDEAESFGRRALTNWRREETSCVRRNVSTLLYLRWAEALVVEKDVAKADRFFLEARTYNDDGPDIALNEIDDYPRAHPIVTALAAEGYSLDARAGIKPGAGTSPLMSALTKNNEAIVRQLLEAGASPDGRGMFGATPLHVAAVQGRPAMVELLLTYGADPTLKNKRAEDAEAVARQRGQTKIAERLAQAKSRFAGPPVRTAREPQTTPSRYNPRPTDNRTAAPPSTRQSC